MTRRKPAPPPDFTHCRHCGARIHWPPRATREHSGPLDPTQVIYLDLDGEPRTMAHEPRWGYAIHGAEVPDLSANEQREADAGRLGEPSNGVRRIVRCCRVHACDPRAVAERRPAPAVHGGQDRAAGEHLS